MITSLRNSPSLRQNRSSLVTVIPPVAGAGGNVNNLQTKQFPQRTRPSCRIIFVPIQKLWCVCACVRACVCVFVTTCCLWNNLAVYSQNNQKNHREVGLTMILM